MRVTYGPKPDWNLFRDRLVKFIERVRLEYAANNCKQALTDKEAADHAGRQECLKEFEDEGYRFSWANKADGETDDMANLQINWD